MLQDQVSFDLDRVSRRQVGLAVLALSFLLCFPLAGAKGRLRPIKRPTQRLTRTTQFVSKSAVVNFAELALRQTLFPRLLTEPRVLPEPDKEAPVNQPIPKAARIIREPVLSAAQPLGPSPALSASFQGSPGTGTSPPDTQGAAGTNHLMTAVNGELRVQTKSGATIGVVHSLGEFFAPVTSDPTGAIDPQLQYDPFENRWILVAMARSFSPSALLAVGVSQTSDPTGNWNLYSIGADPGGQYWIDHPLLGFNKNWIVVTASMVPIEGTGADYRPDVFVFNKASLYANASASLTRFNLPANAGSAIRPTTTLDPNVETMYLLETWRGNSDGVGSLRMFTITGSIGAEVFNNVTSPLFITTTDAWNNGGPPRGGPQLGTNDWIVINGHEIHNVVYRNGSLWCVQTISLPAENEATRSALQWWEILPNGTVRQRGRLDDVTGNLFYAYPSIAVNKNNDVLIGYARFAANLYPGSGYLFRAGSDPLNSARSDTILKAGENPFTLGDGFDPWGDYSATVVDPTNDTDMWTTQEYASTLPFAWRTWWGRVTPPQSGPSPTPTPTPSPSPTPSPAPIQLIIEQSAPASDQVAAVDSVLLLSDPFYVVNGANLFAPAFDRNTRVMVFVTNLQLVPGETSASIVVNLVDQNNQVYDVPAEDVRSVPNFQFTQVIFRLPGAFSAGVCTVRIKAHNQISNPATMRIRI